MKITQQAPATGFPLVVTLDAAYLKNYAVTSYNGRYTISEQVISEELLEYGSEVLVWTPETISLKATGRDKTRSLWNVMIFSLLGYN